MDRFQGKKVLIVGIGKTGFKLIEFFNRLGCELKVTDIKPIFDLNKAVKRLKKVQPSPAMTFGEHKEEDFLEADVIVYSPSVSPVLPQLELARSNGKEVYSEFSLANKLCNKPIIAICGSNGRSTVAHMVGFTLKLEGRNVFVGGTSENPFVEFAMLPGKDEIDYVIVEVSAVQLRSVTDFKPKIVVFTNIEEGYPEKHFESVSDYIETKLSVLKAMGPDDTLVINFDKLANNVFLRNSVCRKYWYSRKSFVNLGVINEVQGTHFHNRRITSNINYHSEFIVAKLRIIGVQNRENLLAAVTVCKTLDVSDKSIQTCIEKFPGIPHRLEFIMEKNGVCFYNDSKSETMSNLVESIKSFKKPIILIAGGKDVEELDFEPYVKDIIDNARVLVLVGESKERMNRVLGEHPQTFIVGSFEESVLFAYQKSRTGDVILLSPGNPSSDFFRDFDERGNYYKKLIYQL